MSYTPTEWATGDVITAEKLNNMEDGIVGSAKVLFIEVNEETGVFNKTWNELKNALSDGVLCLAVFSGDETATITVISSVALLDAGYGIFTDFAKISTTDPIAIAETPDDYPVSNVE